MNKAKDIIHRYGIVGCIQNIFCKLLGIFGLNIEFLYCFSKDLDAPNLTESKFPAYKQLAYDDFENQSKYDPQWFNPHKLRALAQAFSVEGNYAFGCYDDGTLMCYAWISVAKFGLKQLDLKSEDGYLWDHYTTPSYRGKGLHGTMIRICEHELYKRGKKKAIIFVANYNRASRVGVERAGYKQAGRLYTRTFKNGFVQLHFNYGKL